ncbi:hypothetical protein LguiA_029121 [Lonicera macranthoides]
MGHVSRTGVVHAPAQVVEHVFKQISKAYDVLSNPKNDRSTTFTVKKASSPARLLHRRRHSPANVIMPIKTQTLTPAVENFLMCSLEELYKGANKKMKILKSIVDVTWYVFVSVL